MAIMSDKYKLIFILNPRTGCTAVSELMLKKMGGRWVPEKDIMDERGKIKIQRKHTTMPELRSLNILKDDVLAEYTSFTTVRNPFDSLLSLWTKKKYKYVGLKNDPKSFVNTIPGYLEDMQFIESHTFPEWIDHFLKDKKTPAINNKHVQGVDHILRFERLQDTFSNFMDEKGIDVLLEIPTVNQTKERVKNYGTMYDDKSIQIVNEKFRGELEKFNYSF
jgi:hypothetical protein